MGYIFRSKMTTKDGTVIYARDYGKKAFKIPKENNAKKRKK